MYSTKAAEMSEGYEYAPGSLIKGMLLHSKKQQNEVVMGTPEHVQH